MGSQQTLTEKHTMKFSVDKVELGKALPNNQTETGYGNAWAGVKQPVGRRFNDDKPQAKYRLEQASELPKNAVRTDFDRKNMFVEAALTAFKWHFPLKISPDTIWITIMQGFAQHIDKNAEKFRGKFVSFDGKKEICIRRDGFVRGGINDWPGCFPEFCDKIQANLVDGSIRDMVECNYSTTSAIDRVVSQIALMDTVKNYFSYKVMTMCGIPEIELAGTVEDWKKVRDNAKNLLGQFELEFWRENLLPILDRFVAAFDGEIETKFWGSIAKLHSTHGSGGSTYLNGWIQDFFPYTADGEENRCLGSWRAEFEKKAGSDDKDLRRYYRSGGMDYGDVPKGMNTAPFIWNYYGTEISMHFIGAISSVVQDPETLQVEAVTGW